MIKDKNIFKLNGIPFVLDSFVNMSQSAFDKFVKDVKSVKEKDRNRHQIKIAKIENSKDIYDKIQSEIKKRANKKD